MELEEMKKKWEILSQQIEKQKSVNQKMINDSVSGKVSRIISFNVTGALLLLFFILLVGMFPFPFPFAKWFTISLIVILSFCLIWTCVNLCILSKFRSYKNTLCETERYFLIFKKSETINYCVQYLLVIPWSIIFIYQYIRYLHISQFVPILIMALVVLASWVVSFFLTKYYFKRIKEVQKGFDDLKSFMEEE